MKTYMPLLLSALWVTASFPGNIFTALYIDKIGRRKFLLTGLGGITITLILEAVMQAQFLGTNNTAGQKAAIFFIFLCTCAQGTTYRRQVLLPSFCQAVLKNLKTAVAVCRT